MSTSTSDPSSTPPPRPADSTCGCLSSVPRRGWVRWAAPWPGGRCWSCSWWRSCSRAARWPAPAGTARASSGQWERLCSSRWLPGRSRRCGPSASRTTRSPRSPTRAPPSQWSGRSPPTRTPSPARPARSPATRWSGGSPCTGSPAAAAPSTWSRRSWSWAARTSPRCRSVPRCGCTAGWSRPTTGTWRPCCDRAVASRSSSRPARGGGPQRRSGRRSAIVRRHYLARFFIASALKLVGCRLSKRAMRSHGKTAGIR